MSAAPFPGCGLEYELAVVRMGGPELAQLFRVRAQPNDWRAQVAALSKSTSLQAG